MSINNDPSICRSPVFSLFAENPCRQVWDFSENVKRGASGCTSVILETETLNAEFIQLGAGYFQPFSIMEDKRFLTCSGPKPHVCSS